MIQKREREIQQQLELHEEDNIEVQGNYQSLHDEASIREKKLKKVNCTPVSNHISLVYIYIYIIPIPIALFLVPIHSNSSLLFPSFLSLFLTPILFLIPISIPHSYSISHPHSHSSSLFSFLIPILIPHSYSHSSSHSLSPFLFLIPILIPHPYSHSSSLFPFLIPVPIPHPHSYSSSIFSFLLPIPIPCPYSHSSSLFYSSSHSPFLFLIAIPIPCPYSHSSVPFQLQKKLEIAQTEISDYLDERTRRREDLTRKFEELEKQMKLRILIIDNFIPQTEVEKIRDRAEYNEETDCWKLRPIDNTRFSNTSICI